MYVQKLISEKSSSFKNESQAQPNINEESVHCCYNIKQVHNAYKLQLIQSRAMVVSALTMVETLS